MAFVNTRSAYYFSFFLLAVFPLLSVKAYAGSSKAEADEKAGAVLFRDQGCAYCHGVGGIGTKKAPALVDIRKDKAWPAEKITSQILNGGQKMPPFRDSLSDEEIGQLVAYLRAKHRPVPPPAADGQNAPAPH